jgi:hypothetical protein
MLFSHDDPDRNQLVRPGFDLNFLGLVLDGTISDIEGGYARATDVCPQPG